MQSLSFRLQSQSERVCCSCLSLINTCRIIYHSFCYFFFFLILCFVSQEVDAPKYHFAGGVPLALDSVCTMLPLYLFQEYRVGEYIELSQDQLDRLFPEGLAGEVCTLSSLLRRC